MNANYAVVTGSICLALAGFIFRSSRSAYTRFSRRRLLLLSAIGLTTSGYGAFQVVHALLTHEVLCVRRACNSVITESAQSAVYNHHLLGWALISSVTIGATLAFLSALSGARRAP
jgi:hypothetical protein